MANEHDHQDRKFTALYIGQVVDNADPEKLGRVRVRIPGLIEQKSRWAFPLGWPGAGTKKRGMFAPPPKGADVGVMFHQGDIDHPYYLGGHPGRGEAPDEVDESSPEDATKVWAFESDRFKFLFDGRPGKQLIQLRDKKTGDVIEIDGRALGVNITATSAINIKAKGAVNIDGANVTIAGRLVARNGKPI